MNRGMIDSVSNDESDGTMMIDSASNDESDGTMNCGMIVHSR